MKISILAIRMIVLLALVSTGSSCFSAEEIQIITYEIEGLHQADRLGKYDKVLTAVLPSEYQYSIVIAPPKRALRMFEQCVACCLSPMNDNPEFYDYAETLGAVQLPAFNTANAYLFSQRGSQPIRQLEDLTGKTIALQGGMSFGNGFIERTKLLNIKSVQVSDFDSLFKMLELKRVDAVAAYTPDALLYFANQKVSAYPFLKAHPLVIHEDALLCKNQPQEFLTRYRVNMESFSLTEEFEVLMGDLK